MLPTPPLNYWINLINILWGRHLLEAKGRTLWAWFSTSTFVWVLGLKLESLVFTTKSFLGFVISPALDSDFNSILSLSSRAMGNISFSCLWYKAGEATVDSLHWPSKPGESCSWMLGDPLAIYLEKWPSRESSIKTEKEGFHFGGTLSQF